MGVIGRPHGVRGLVRVTSYADDLTAYGPLSDAKGRRFVLRWRGEGVAEIAEMVAGGEVKVADRTAAETADQHAALCRAGAVAGAGGRRVLSGGSDRAGCVRSRRRAARHGRARCMTTVPAQAWRSRGKMIRRCWCHSPGRACRWWMWSVGGRDRAADLRRRVMSVAPRHPPRRYAPRPRIESGAGSLPLAGEVNAMTWRASVLTLFPEMFPGPLGAFACRPRPAVGDLVAADGQHPRLRHRPASHGGRHAVRRRRRHGAAPRRGRCRHCLGRR